MTASRPLAATLTEAQLQAAVLQLAHILGWKIYHPWISVRSTAGFPDLVLCKPPRLLIVELKREGKHPTAAQADWLAALAASGVETAVWRPSDWLGGVIERVLKGAQMP